MSSSPFEIFRRNLKPLMVFLTLLALVSFVVLPALDTYLRQGGGASGDPVAAVYDGVELRASRVSLATQTHRAMVEFLRALAMETISRGGMPQTPGFQIDQQSGEIRSLGVDANPNEEATIAAMRFYNEARKAGFELDDTSIENWLARFTDGTLSDTEITQILMRSTGNQLGQLSLYEQLRTHLLADLYQRSALAGLTMGQFPVVTPVAQWQNFLKLNQQATIDVYGVLVANYIEKTDANPSAAEIRRVYDDGKSRIAYPNDQTPTPKFRRPDSAKFEYVAADLKQFVEREKAKLTDQQLRAEYERRLEGGDFQMPITESDDLMEKLGSPEVAAEAPSGQTPPAKEPASTKEPEADEPEATTPDPEDGSSVSGTSAIRLVAFQDDAETAAKAVVTEEAATTAAEKVVDPVAEKAADTPAEVAPEEPAATVESKSDESMKSESSDSLELGDAPEPTKPRAFEEVSDQIAESLASEPARKELDELVTKINGIMRRYFSERAIHESNVSVGVAQAEDAPERPDLKAIAAEYGLQHGETDLVNRVSVAETVPGSSFGLGSTFNQRGAPFGAMMFGAQLQNGGQIPAQPVYSPLRTVDLEKQVTYITWKTQDLESYTPTLDEARDEVVLAIRTAQARELARQAAQQIADQANGQPLAKVVPDDNAANYKTNLGPFSWLNQVGFMETTIGNVEELDAVGEDFMRATFTTEVAKVGVAPNAPQTVYYVIQPTKFQPELQQLREQFRQPQQRFMAMLLGTNDARDLIRGFYQAVDKRTGFEMKLGMDEKDR